MYNLRFYLDDNDNIIKCDYKQIAGNNELDSMFYNDLMANKNDLKRDFMLLAKHDLNHKYTIQPNYILHEFVVPSGIINDLKAKMKAYKNELDNNLASRRTTQKFNNTESTNTKPEVVKHGKYVIRRENKFKRRRVIASILVLATLSTAIYGGVKVTQSVASALDNTDMVVEDFNPQMSAAQMAELIEAEKDKQSAIEKMNAIEQSNQNAEEEITNIVPTSTPVQEDQIVTDEKYDYEVNITAEDWTGSQKYIDCYNNYYPLIEKYAKMYGIDPNIALAIACHERGEHSNEIDSGGGLGLFQVQVDVWNGHSVRAFNFETNEWEEYAIYTDNIRNLEQNIKAGMMIFQECLIRDDYNLTMAVQEYNFGHGGLMTSINAASNALGESVDTLTQNDNTDWFDYRTYNVSSDGYQMGDPNYVENVFKYVNDNESLHFTKPDGEQISVKYHNLSNEYVRG